MARILGKTFYARDAKTVAKALIGKFLVRKRGRRVEARMITETEAYDGFHDKASHAHRGRTPRNAPMFGGPGHWYVYFVYGIHWMLNAVTGPEGYPAAVLIRGVEGARGPARLTKALHITRPQNDAAIGKASGLWVEDRGARFAPRRIGRGPRIGVDYAGTWAKKPYRFFLKH